MRMDSFPRFTRSALFKDLLVQDLDGKQLPVLDITPPAPSEAAAQDCSSDPSKAKVTRASSTKVSWSIKSRIALCYRHTILHMKYYLY